MLVYAPHQNYLDMKKIIIICGFMAAMFCLIIKNEETQKKAEQNVVTDDFVKSKTSGQKLRVVNVLITTGKLGYGSSSVAYLLLENDDVIIYRSGAHQPFTKDEARIIMKAQMGDTVYVERNSHY